MWRLLCWSIVSEIIVRFRIGCTCYCYIHFDILWLTRKRCHVRERTVKVVPAFWLFKTHFIPALVNLLRTISFFVRYTFLGALYGLRGGGEVWLCNVTNGWNEASFRSKFLLSHLHVSIRVNNRSAFWLHFWFPSLAIHDPFGRVDVRYLGLLETWTQTRERLTTALIWWNFFLLLYIIV